MANSPETKNLPANLADIKAYFLTLQEKICNGLTFLDGKGQFREDKWDRQEGGGGRTRVIQNGNVFEKGGVNFSHVFGSMPDNISKKLGLPKDVFFDATGVSIVLHPKSPHVPIIHMNIRYFQTASGHNWFGGGIDLTPIYVVPEDAHFFHKALKTTCDQFDPNYYRKFKEWCDQYFYIKHRQENRGVGGIFFDKLTGENDEEMAANFAFVRAVGETFFPTYQAIVSRHRNEPYSIMEKNFQAFRRSRYVEFNLVYDKGTKFGLDTGGRIESILMSMPPQAEWGYNYKPESGTREAFTIDHLQPLDWVEA